MVIYVECVIFNNIAINSLVLYLSLIITKRNITWWRVLIASAIGAGYALAMPLFEFKGDFILKILLAFVICLIAVRPLSIKKYLFFTLVFFIITFTLGGIIIGAQNIFNVTHNSLFKVNTFNIGLAVSACLFLIIATRKLIILINKKRSKENNVRKVIMTTKKGIISEKGYYDSGNTMYYMGIHPVIVVDESLKPLSSAVGKLKLNTISGNSEKEVYKLEHLMIDNRHYESVYCIVNKLEGRYKVLLHNDTY